MQNQDAKHEPLYQVWVTDKLTGRIIPASPKLIKKAVEQIASVLSEQIRTGRIKTLADPHIAMHLGPARNH